MGTLGEEFVRLQQAKQAIKEAIREKGVDVRDDLPIEGYAAKIRAIKTYERYKLLAKEGFSGHYLRKLPDVDIVGVADMSNKFSGMPFLDDVIVFDIVDVTSLSKTFANSPLIREITLLHPRDHLNMNGTFSGCSGLRRISFGGVEFSPSTLATTFMQCVSLEEVDGVLNLKNIAGGGGFGMYTVDGCPRLERIKIKGLRESMSFRGQVNLSVESIDFLIDNAAEVQGKSITLNGAVRGRVSQGKIELATQKGWTIAFV